MSPRNRSPTPNPRRPPRVERCQRCRTASTARTPVCNRLRRQQRRLSSLKRPSRRELRLHLPLQETMMLVVLSLTDDTTDETMDVTFSKTTADELWSSVSRSLSIRSTPTIKRTRRGRRVCRGHAGRNQLEDADRDVTDRQVAFPRRVLVGRHECHRGSTVLRSLLTANPQQSDLTTQTMDVTGVLG